MEIYDRGDFIKKLRIEHNLTQKQLSVRLGVSEATVCKYESNTSIPPFETLRSLASIFNVSMDDLCGMKRQGTISTHGLSENQIQTLKKLIEAYHTKNAQTGKALTQEQFAVLGRIVAELTK